MKRFKKDKDKYAGLYLKTAAFLVMLFAFFAAMPVIPGVKIIYVKEVLAAEKFEIEHINGFSVIQGEETTVVVEVTNNTDSDADVTVSLSGGRGDLDITSSSQSATTIRKGGAIQASFVVKAGRHADTGYQSLTVTVKDGNGTDYIERIEINVSQNLSPGTGSLAAAFDITMTQGTEGLAVGEVKNLTFELFNKGNTYLKNTMVSLSLPEGLSIQGGSSSVNLGYVTIGTAKNATFPVTAEKDVTTKNYPITVKISGVDSGGNTQDVEQVFYIPVTGEDEDDEEIVIENVEVGNINIPESVEQDTDFKLTFQVFNMGDKDIEDAKLTVEVPEGLVNRSRNIFVIPKLSKGSPQTFSVTFYAPALSEEENQERYYPLKIIIEPMTPDENHRGSVSQYAGVLVKKAPEDDDTGKIKTPQLIVSNYSYGGTYAYAGGKFRLNLSFLNTSSEHNVRNIKVTVNSEDGTFVPVGSSNTFYIDSISKKGTTANALMMSVKPDAEQKTSAMTISMTYEDMDGNSFEASDLISIPVQQESRLVVDDITQPPEIYLGMESYVSVPFYNMGKTTLNNLRVTAEGNFDISGSQMYFVGNMEAGSSDYYDFAFIPQDPELMIGSVVFTYEDASGQEIVYEKPFEFTVMGDMMMEDPGMMDPEMMEPQGGGIPWKFIIPALLLLLAAGFIIFKRRRKKKLNQQMELED